MTDYTLEREYRIRNTIWASTIRISPSDDGGVNITGIAGGSHSIEEANAIAHAILHCITDIQHFQASVDEKLRPERVPDRDGWTTHDGKDIPVPGHILVEVEFRNGETNDALWASSWHHPTEANLSNWIHVGSSADIVRYRVVPQ